MLGAVAGDVIGSIEREVVKRLDARLLALLDRFRSRYGGGELH